MTEAEGLGILRRGLPAVLSRGVGALLRHNRRLWRLEDQLRATEVPTRIAELEREREAASVARRAGITAIDAAVLTRYKRGARPRERGAVLDSSSIGQQLDRLTILVLKRARVVGPTAHGIARARWEHALACLERSVAALVAGRWVHHPAGAVRQYGPAPRRRRAVTRRSTTTRSRAGRRSRRAGPTTG